MPSIRYWPGRWKKTVIEIAAVPAGVLKCTFAGCQSAVSAGTSSDDQL